MTCRVLTIARPPYYRWLQTPVTGADLAGAYQANAVFHAHRDDPEFGYRYLLEEAADAGEVMEERTAWRICSQQRWWSAFGKKRAKNGKKPGPPVHNDLCAPVDKHGVTRHMFTADAPNQLWLADSVADAPPKPNTGPAKGGCTCARSRTSSPTGSSGTGSTRG